MEDAKQGILLCIASDLAKALADCRGCSRYAHRAFDSLVGTLSLEGFLRKCGNHVAKGKRRGVSKVLRELERRTTNQLKGQLPRSEKEENDDVFGWKRDIGMLRPYCKME